VVNYGWQPMSHAAQQVHSDLCAQRRNINLRSDLVEAEAAADANEFVESIDQKLRGFTG
jgi:hypothetical protein